MLSKYVLNRLRLAQEGAPAAAPNQTPGDINPRTPEDSKPGDPPAVEPPTDETPVEPVEGKDDPLLAALLSGYRDGEQPPIEAAPEGDPAAPAAPAEPVVAAPVVATPAAPAAPAVKKVRKEILPPDLNDEPKPQPVAVLPSPTPTQTPAAESDADYIASLTNEQREELNEADYAERLLPEKYKGRRKQLLAFYKKVDDTYARKTAEKSDDQDFNIVEDAEYKQVLNSKPKLEGTDLRRVVKKMGADDVRRELDPELQEIRRHQAEAELTPRLAVVAENFSTATREMLAGDEASPFAPVLKLALEKGIEEARKLHPLETEIAIEEGARGREMASEYIRLVRMTKAGHNVFDANRKIHTEIVDFINTEGARFAEHGGEFLNRNGKLFMPRARLAAARRNNPTVDPDSLYWTFSDEDVLGIMAQRTKANMEIRLAEEETRAKSRGFVKAAPVSSATPPNPPKAEPQPLTPPKVTTSVAKGPAGKVIVAGEVDVAAVLYRN